MGGQALYPDSLVLDMRSFNEIESLDEKSHIVTVQSGATWKDLQEFLNPRGLAVIAMQGPSIFSIGGSLSVNAHGWDLRHSVVADSVEWFRLLLADGSIRRCSRTENPELFRLVLGGYGLFGVILDVGLRVTDNDGYAASISVMDYKQYPDYFDRHIAANPDIELAEADLSIAPKSFLRELVAVSYARQIKAGPRLDPLQQEEHVSRDKVFFILSRKYQWGKTLRWYLQKRLEYPATNTVRTRNNIFRSPVERLQYYSPNDTDILQEYFVPKESFVRFIDGARAIFQEHSVNLLSVTVRHVAANQDSFLNYAQRERVAIVIYLNVQTSAVGQIEAARVTRELTDLAQDQGGTFYLPYVLYYEKSQLKRAYPEIEEFFRNKRQYDPSELFMNDFYARYSK